MTIADSLSCWCANKKPIVDKSIVRRFAAKPSTMLSSARKKAASMSGGKMLEYLPEGLWLICGCAQTRIVVSVSRPLGEEASCALPAGVSQKGCEGLMLVKMVSGEEPRGEKGELTARSRVVPREGCVPHLGLSGLGALMGASRWTVDGCPWGCGCCR